MIGDSTYSLAGTTHHLFGNRYMGKPPSTSPQNLLIRPAIQADIGEITAIYAANVLHGTASFEITPPDGAEMRGRWERLRSLECPYLVAISAERIAGYAYAGPYRPRPAYRHTVEGSVYVADWAQRRGLGRALLGALIKACTQAGFRQMVAIIGDSAHIASIRLHERCGFAMVGTLKDVGFKHGRWLDSVIMQRSLGGGATTPAPDSSPAGAGP